MKKFICLLLAAVLVTGMLSGCDHADTANGETLSIVTTIFPAYDWTRQILGGGAEHVRLTMLLDSGVDLHNYQPSVDDIITISMCDMFIYVGGTSDAWVEDALAQAKNEDMVVVDLLDVLGDEVKEEEHIDGMESEEEHEEEETHGHEADEHVWLSLKNAKTVCAHIARQLGSIDADNADIYTANSDAYIAQLEALDGQYQSAVAAGTFDTLLFGDRFPFRYLTDDYGLSYYAAFSGCSAETEASFETVAFLAKKVDELGLNCVICIEGGDQSVAKTVIQNTASQDQQLLSLDSMQAITAQEVAAGATYLGIMQSNLEVLKTALNTKEN